MIGSIRFPEIIELKYVDTEVKIICKIPQDLSYCDGHFPGMPIVPGVVQLHWAVHYAKEFIRPFDAVLGASQLKFSNIIQPGCDVILCLKHDEVAHVVHYVYQGKEKTYSSGRFSYGDVV